VRQDVPAAVQDHFASPLVEEIADPFMMRLKKVLVNGCGKEHAVFITKIIEHERPIKRVSQAEYLLRTRKHKLRMGFEHVIHPVRGDNKRNQIISL